MKKNLNLIIFISLLILVTACTKEPVKDSTVVYESTNPRDRVPRVYPINNPPQPVPSPSATTYPSETTIQPPVVYRRDTSREDRRRKLFYETDKNNNKKISAKEYLAYCIHRTHTWNDKFINHYIKTHDKNGDGKLTQAEADKPRFDEIDKNNDNFITAEEISLDWRGIERRVIVTPPPTAEENLALRIENIKKDILFCDTDKDGRISLSEGMHDRCDSMTKEEFAKYDRDNDNYISVEDLLRPRSTEQPVKVHGYADMEKEMRFIFALGYCDKNHNSNLDEKEMTSKECGFSKQDFIASDYDKDGRYTKEDLDYKRYMRTFHKANKNKNMGLNLDEFMQLPKVGTVPY